MTLDKQQRNLRDAATPQGRATADSRGRALTSMGGLFERLPRFPACLPAVSWGGLLTALPALLQEGLLSRSHALRLPKGYFGLQSILLTVAFMLLSGTKNPERLRYVQPGEIGAMLSSPAQQYPPSTPVVEALLLQIGYCRKKEVGAAGNAVMGGGPGSLRPRSVAH